MQFSSKKLYSLYFGKISSALIRKISEFPVFSLSDRDFLLPFPLVFPAQRGP